MLCADMKVSEAVKYISDLLHLNDSDKAIGLYVSADRVWLNDDMPLSSYKGLKFLVRKTLNSTN
jgi:hypothetical protein